MHYIYTLSSLYRALCINTKECELTRITYKVKSYVVHDGAGSRSGRVRERIHK